MQVKPNFPFVLHGGDYNPEQWPIETWDEDVRLMQRAGWNIATLPVFGWGNLQLGENEWNFTWLDQVIEKLHSGGIRLCLATGTAATPPWIDQAYPDILRTDSKGVKRRHGGRHTCCPHSPNFARLSTGLATKMAERYGSHPALLLWHISNEYGETCYCNLCAEAFRSWLKVRYGTLAELNFRWNMAFWGQTYTDWSQIEPPVENAQRNFQGLLIDYDRFQSESLHNQCLAEMEVLRRITPQIPITTNFMGTFKPLDYHKWAPDLDIISWDSYPARNATPSQIALRHSLMRGLKDGQPWMLMEQTPSQQNWQSYNSLKRPGVMRLWSYQAMAHGADAVMYFQWRRSPGAQEMLHGAVVEHAGREDARVFKEVAALGAELARIEKVTLGGRVKTDVAFLFDWENWWAVEYSSGPSVDLKYIKVMETLYSALFDLGIVADVVSPNSDLSGYRLIVAPALKMVKPGVAESIKAAVQGGASFITTFFSGITDATDRAFTNGYPGPLSDLLGIWVEESDALAQDDRNGLHFSDQSESQCSLLCDRIQLQGAEAIAHYTKDFYAGEPAITVFPYGEGAAFYLGTLPDRAGLKSVFRSAIRRSGVTMPHGISVPKDVEITERVSELGSLLYILNHNSNEVEILLPARNYRSVIDDAVVNHTLTLPAYGVAILTTEV